MRYVVLSFAAVISMLGVLSAAEPRVVFEDKLVDKLGDGWSWLREDAKTWRIGKEASRFASSRAWPTP